MTSRPTLSPALVPTLTPRADLLLPSAAQLALPERAVQFGTGALLRGLVDALLDDANRQELFGGRVVMISDTAGVARLADRLAFGIAVPNCDPFVAPLLYAIPIQLLAYHTAVLKGTDVDQPRNLAKSVTVE